MELVIQVLMLFIVVAAIFKLSFWKWWQAAIFAVVCAGFIIWAYPWAIEQSKTQIADYRQDPQALQNSAVLITLESVLCFAFCVMELLGRKSKKQKLWAQALHWYPSLLIFPVLFYLLTQSVYAFPGRSFAGIAYCLAGAVAVVIPLARYAVKYLCPEKEFRLEIYFLLSLFVCITGLITTVNGNVTYAPAEEPLNIEAIILSGGLFLIAFLSGNLWNRLKWTIYSRKQIKNR